MSKSKTHSLKILPEYFEAVLSGDKTFEIRYNDRDYKVGDSLCLKEFCDGAYTGRETIREICYMIDDPAYCKEGYVVLGLKQSEGEWITKGDELKNTTCSVCNYWVETPYGKTPYCPHCGAKMKGGEDNE